MTAVTMPNRRRRLALPIVAGVLLLDQLTKWWALEALGDGRSISPPWA